MICVFNTSCVYALEWPDDWISFLLHKYNAMAVLDILIPEAPMELPPMLLNEWAEENIKRIFLPIARRNCGSWKDVLKSTVVVDLRKHGNIYLAEAFNQMGLTCLSLIVREKDRPFSGDIWEFKELPAVGRFQLSTILQKQIEEERRQFDEALSG